MLGMVLKSVPEWQAAQLAPAAVGMWFGGLLLAVKSLVVWQSEHSPPLGCDASTTLKPVAVACGRVWKPLNGALVVIGY